MEDVEDAETLKSVPSSASGVRKAKRGIVYLSNIPKFMNIAKIRELFSVHGKIGRIYLQLAENG